MTQDMNDLERDIEQARARLDLTINRLQDRLSMSGMVDDVLGTMRANQLGSHFDYALDVIKRNPVPVMLVAAGVGWLLHRMSTQPVRPAVSARVAAYDEDELPVVDVHRPHVYQPETTLPVREAATLPVNDSLQPRRTATAGSPL
jgi:hypothetical protein